MCELSTSSGSSPTVNFYATSPHAIAPIPRYSALTHPTVVIPCFNEIRRLPVERIQALGHHHGVQLVLVDDGSTDGTALALERICRALPRGKARLIVLDRNVGKAEAVRRGLLSALENGSAPLNSCRSAAPVFTTRLSWNWARSSVRRPRRIALA